MSVDSAPGFPAFFGVDFTSAPSNAKPITCAEAAFDGKILHVRQVVGWTSFDEFEAFLSHEGPWVAGLDFPFAQARRLIENIGWPESWAAYVARVGTMSRRDFRLALEAYKAPRRAGDKHHKRECDKLSQSQSPQTLNYTPVGLMFFEGAPRLLASGAHLPHLHDGDPDRIVLEAYPGVAARALVGKIPYKNDDPRKQRAEHLAARHRMLERLVQGACEATYGFALDVDTSVADEPGGDRLDAVLCAVQAAWAWTLRDRDFGAPSCYDRLEGWICDPTLARSATE